MGEQPNPLDLLQTQDAMSRHRGAKPLRRCELLGVISLLSPGDVYKRQDQMALLNNAVVGKKGNYVYYMCGADAQNWRTAFLSMI